MDVYRLTVGSRICYWWFYNLWGSIHTLVFNTLQNWWDFRSLTHSIFLLHKLRDSDLVGTTSLKIDLPFRDTISEFRIDEDGSFRDKLLISSLEIIGGILHWFVWISLLLIIRWHVVAISSGYFIIDNRSVGLQLQHFELRGLVLWQGWLPLGVLLSHHL